MKKLSVLFILSWSSIASAQDGWFQASKAGDVKSLKQQLLDNPAVLNEKDQKGYTALIYAAYYGEEKAVKYLLERGADPCLADNRGNTATLGAVFKGHLGIVRQLMKAPCSHQNKNEAGQTPLMFAALFGRQEIAHELLRKGADPAEKDVQGMNALDLAHSQVNDEMVRILEKSASKLP